MPARREVMSATRRICMFDDRQRQTVSISDRLDGLEDDAVTLTRIKIARKALKNRAASLFRRASSSNNDLAADGSCFCRCEASGMPFLASVIEDNI
jgi:hypothetical protein